MRRRRVLSLLTLSLFALAAAGCGDDDTTGPLTTTTTTGPSVDEIMADLPESCAFSCADCAEPETAFACPALAPWDELPHAEACEDWDGTYPEPQQGRCTASEPTGEAARPAGPFAGGLVLPDGHRIRPAGREVVFDEPDLLGTFPMSIVPLAGSRFALVSDGGIRDNVLRVISLDALAGGGDPVASYVPFPRPTSLYYGVAYLAPDRVLASGGGDGIIYAFDIDTQTGQLTRAMSRDIDLGTAGTGSNAARWYSGAIAVNQAGDRLVVAPSEHASEIVIVSLAAADYGSRLAAIPLTGTRTLFDLQLDPFDPQGDTFYATDMAGRRLLEIDATSATITREVALEKNPEQLVFLDATWLAVAQADSDALAIVNRATGQVAAQVPVFEPDAPRGFSPTALAYDAAQQRLYAALSGVNAVEVYDVAPGSPPSVTPAGRIPTSWWPTGVMVDADGSLVIINGKGRGGGADPTAYAWTDSMITERMAGSIQHVPPAELAGLAALTAITDENRRLGEASGRSEVTCPAGAPYDFPIPEDNTSGPSQHIKHVVMVIRENKTYDAVFGDRPDLGNGDPALILAQDADLQAAVWRNFRAMAGAFTNFDNFYTDAEQSLQGHIWTVYGRTNDYMERAWLSTWGRGSRPPTMTITSMAKPEENGVFMWLSANGVSVENMGEIVGDAPEGLDLSYPGLAYAGNLPDTEKSCYMLGRARLRCDLRSFTYALQPNDHTNGGDAGSAAPEVMIAVNDEASGMLLDGLSHSPMWKDTLLIITEDDPQNGGDHVDVHRTPLVMASPWVKRGYVSKGHYDMASVYKLIAHIFGVPYNNEMIRHALLPLDAFTSTPDYTPFTYEPRTVDAPCNPSATREAREAESWDFAAPDEQPGLSQQVMDMMKRSRERGVKLVTPR